LTRLNRELAGNLKSGFVTCICARLDGGGLVTIANAGHLSGWINADEIATPGMLPLGVTDAGVQYPTEQIQLKIGDTLTFLSDGVVEARCESEGALFGFERLQQLLTERPDPGTIAREAQLFGQEDDISVVTIQWMGTEIGVPAKIAPAESSAVAH
jgi:serine phosphatase RsbU (regulator of sigma subunit)